MKALLLLLPFTLLMATSGEAAIPTGMSVTIQPIVGYSFERKSNPDRKERVLVYGGRVIAGYRLLSAEAEYTRGDSDAVYSNPSLRIEELSEKARLGIRSTYDLAMILSFTARGGGEASRRTTERTESGVTTKSKSPTVVNPYLGAGLGVHLGSFVSLNAEVVATIPDVNDLSRNEYTTTLGVTLSVF